MILFMLFLLLTSPQTIHAQDGNITFGAFADCQYCDCETHGTRYYRNAYEKLKSAINHFNEVKNMDFIVNLGDLIDNGFESFAPVMSLLEKSENPIFHILGNHDFSVEPQYLSEVPKQLGLDKTYYSFSEKGWKFIILDGNDISFSSADEGKVKLAETMSAQLKSEGKPNHHNWNGAIGEEQLQWFDNQLLQAENQNRKVAVFCHFPVLPYESHTLWNQAEIISVIEKYNCVKLWLNGHNHAGNYAFHHGVYFVNLKGMVETESENAFSVITLSDDFIEITGFGREKSQKLSISGKN